MGLMIILGVFSAAVLTSLYLCNVNAGILRSKVEEFF